MYGAERFKEILNKYSNRPIILYGDPDVDGLISLLLMCQFCDMLGLKYSYYVNDDRFHGFQLDKEKLKGYLIISADFSISETEVQELVDNDVVILGTDHHEVHSSEFIDKKSATAEGIFINNQYKFEPQEDAYLSGAGVFFELICSIYPEFFTKERQALVGITLLSDIRQIENKKAREYLKAAYTFDTTQEGYIKYLIESVMDSDYGFGVPRLDRNFIDFTLSPCINALLRANKTQEAVNFIMGNGLASTAERTNQKDIQAIIESKLKVFPMNSLHIIWVNALDFIGTNISLTSYIGLMCGRYKDKHKGVSTLGFVYENGQILRTSFRGKYDDIMYLSGVRNLGIKAEGHHNAFGIIDFRPTEETWVLLDDLVTDLEVMHHSTIKVIPSNNLMLTLVKSGQEMANENCYVRDMYRSYIKYTGKNVKEVKRTYKLLEFMPEDYASGVKPDEIKNGIYYKYDKDADGNPIAKYIEYLVDGRTVKSFGVELEDGYILPILDRGYVKLYVKSPLE